MALRQFIKEGFRPPAILFTETKERCQRIMGELLYDGINAMSLCAAKSPAERQKVIQATRLGLGQNSSHGKFLRLTDVKWSIF